VSAEYRILVAIDLKPGTDRVLAEARRYAEALQGIVDIIHVAEPDPAFIGYIKAPSKEEQSTTDSGRILRARELREEHRKTQAFEASLRDTGIRVGQALTVQGPILATILEEAKKLKSDLLVLGSHQHGALYRLWYADIAREAVEHTPCALLVVPVR
jgi:nucleotide-binding universal stress UspA family protein